MVLPQFLCICIIAALTVPTRGQDATLPGTAFRHRNESKQCENNTKPNQRKESYSGQNGLVLVFLRMVPGASFFAQLCRTLYEHKCKDHIFVLEGANNILLLGVPNLPESAEQLFLRGKSGLLLHK